MTKLSYWQQQETEWSEHAVYSDYKKVDSLEIRFEFLADTRKDQGSSRGDDFDDIRGTTMSSI